MLFAFLVRLERLKFVVWVWLGFVNVAIWLNFRLGFVEFRHSERSEESIKN